MCSGPWVWCANKATGCHAGEHQRCSNKDNYPKYLLEIKNLITETQLMIWKAKDINIEQALTVLSHLPDSNYMSHLWHVNPLQSCRGILIMRHLNIWLLTGRDLFIYIFLHWEITRYKSLEAEYCPCTVNGAITAWALLVEQSQISYCTATLLVPQWQGRMFFLEWAERNSREINMAQIASCKDRS